jgi:hypothetical protein
MNAADKIRAMAAEAEVRAAEADEAHITIRRLMDALDAEDRADPMGDLDGREHHRRAAERLYRLGQASAITRATAARFLRAEANAIEAAQDMGLPVEAIREMDARARLLRAAADELDGGAPPLTPEQLEKLIERLPTERQAEARLMLDARKRADEIEAEAAKYTRQPDFEDAVRFAREAHEDIDRARGERSRAERRIDAAAWLLIAQRMLAREAGR